MTNVKQNGRLRCQFFIYCWFLWITPTKQHASHNKLWRARTHTHTYKNAYTQKEMAKRRTKQNKKQKIVTTLSCNIYSLFFPWWQGCRVISRVSLFGTNSLPLCVTNSIKKKKTSLRFTPPFCLCLLYSRFYLSCTLFFMFNCKTRWAGHTMGFWLPSAHAHQGAHILFNRRGRNLRFKSLAFYWFMNIKIQPLNTLSHSHSGEYHPLSRFIYSKIIDSLIIFKVWDYLLSYWRDYALENTNNNYVIIKLSSLIFHRIIYITCHVHMVAMHVLIDNSILQFLKV